MLIYLLLVEMSGHAGQLTLEDRLNIVVRNLSNSNSFILESHKIKNNALNASHQQNQSLRV